MRILIIDDDRAHGESLSDLLNTKGHEAYFAPSLDEAAWLLELFRFELALLDHDMPGQTGPEVARVLTTRLPKLQTILMSARDPASRGPSDSRSYPFLGKPIQVPSLLELMANLAAGTSIIRRAPYPVTRYRDDELP